MNRLRLFLLPLLLLASACSRESFLKALAGPQIHLAYDDFGTEAMAAPLLGPRTGNTPVIVHHGRTHARPEGMFVNAQQMMYHMRREARKLPRTPENEALRQRLTATYGRLYHFYRTRRDAVMSAPFSSYGRGSINRALMVPPMPPTL